jgi:protein phosphatase
MGKKQGANYSPPVYTIAGITDVGGRKANEDSIFTMEMDLFMKCSAVPAYQFRGALGIVADGMGGGAYGEQASSIAIRTFVREFVGQIVDSDTRNKPDEIKKTVEKAMRNAYDSANKEVYESASRKGVAGNMATTLTAAFSIGNWLIVGNVGDSRCYIIQPGVANRPFTADQSKVYDMFLKGEITYEQIRSHPQKNIILKAVGAEPSVKPSIKHKEFADETTKDPAHSGKSATPTALLLCSDGLSDVILDEHLQKEVLMYLGDRSVNLEKRRQDLYEACQRLYTYSVNNNTRDNVSVVLMDITEVIQGPAMDVATYRAEKTTRIAR